jgi:hypothetical protein
MRRAPSYLPIFFDRGGVVKRETVKRETRTGSAASFKLARRKGGGATVPVSVRAAAI